MEVKKEKAEADNSLVEVWPIFQIVKSAGLGFEEHYVQTQDGYLLTLHRIFKESPEGKPVVFLQHGILSSSEAWILHGADSMAFKLAEHGYDVWLGNNRGTLYSRHHAYLNPDSPDDERKFFDFSFYELGQYDLPAQIDYALDTSK